MSKYGEVTYGRIYIYRLICAANAKIFAKHATTTAEFFLSRLNLHMRETVHNKHNNGFIRLRLPLLILNRFSAGW